MGRVGSSATSGVLITMGSALPATSGSIMSLILKVENAARQPKVRVGDGLPPILRSYMIKVGVQWVCFLFKGRAFGGWCKYWL